MKVITKNYNVYDLNELPEESQEKAYEDYCHDFDYFSHEDNVASLERFAKHFDVTIKDYEYNSYNGNDHVDFEISKDIKELSYVRLWKYLHNHDLVTTIFATCPFTGIYVDEDLLAPIRAFIKKPYDITFCELIQNCVDNWIDTCNKDIEYQQSLECFKESSEINEWKYLENGKLF